jgi:hypothetical protein
VAPGAGRLPDFCRSQLCTVVHGHAVCNGRDRKKQLKFNNLRAAAFTPVPGSFVRRVVLVSSSAVRLFCVEVDVRWSRNARD